MRGIVPGSYALMAQTTVGDRRFSARYPLQAGSTDIDSIEMDLVAVLDLKGVIRIEGVTETKPAQVILRFDGRSGRGASTPSTLARMVSGARVVSSSGGAAEDGTFSLSLDPDFYRVSATAPDTLYLKSVACGTTDVTGAGLDLTGGGPCEVTVVMSANGGQLEGQVTDADSQPAPSVQVTLVPTGSLRTDLFKGATTDASGHFKIGAIVPGGYKVYAWEEVDTNDVRYDPEFAKPHENSAQSVRIAEGSKETVSLKLMRSPPTASWALNSSMVGDPETAPKTNPPTAHAIHQARRPINRQITPSPNPEFLLRPLSLLAGFH